MLDQLGLFWTEATDGRYVSDKDSNWRFADDIIVESEVITRARQQSLELGVDPIAPSTGAQAAVVVAATRAENIVEIGTGVGVSGLWLLHGGTEAQLTSIDVEVDHQQHARTFFTEAGIAANRVRLITGHALDVLPRMNENSYDIVFVAADPQSVIEYVEHGLRLVRPGGTVLVARALWRGRVADPAARDPLSTGFRTLITETAASGAVISALSPAGDGLLQLTKLTPSPTSRATTHERGKGPDRSGPFLGYLVRWVTSGSAHHARESVVQFLGLRIVDGDDQTSPTFERYPHDDEPSLLHSLHRPVPGPRLHGRHAAPLS